MFNIKKTENVLYSVGSYVKYQLSNNRKRLYVWIGSLIILLDKQNIKQNKKGKQNNESLTNINISYY
jgi:hypothetical protein